MKFSSKNLAILFCLLIPFFLHACAYGIADDKRLLDTMSSDTKMATAIKTAILEKSFSSGLSIAVYCYYKNVYLVGEIPEHLQDKIVEIAALNKPKSITTHFFTHEDSQESDFLLSTRLRTALIQAKGLSSTRIDTEINAGRVVLLGVVESEREKQIAIQAAKRVSGVRSVTSYLILPIYAKQVHSEDLE